MNPVSSVLLQVVDPTQAINVADKLAHGDVQTFLAYGLVGVIVLFGGGFVWAIRFAIAEVKSCADERTKMAVGMADALAKNTAAIDGHSEILKTTLEALKAR